MEFFSWSILPFAALTGITGRMLLKHKIYNLFLKERCLGSVACHCEWDLVYLLWCMFEN